MALSLILLMLVIISWMPIQGIPGASDERSGRAIPGLLGILFFLLAGRQLFLRGLARDSQ